jgi:hypothetical protein
MILESRIIIIYKEKSYKDIMKLNWNTFLEEGNELFNYMTNNFKSMFKNNMITHFKVIDGIYPSIDKDDIIINTHINNIEKELINFIKKESESKLLFDKTNWKPFRDKLSLTTMYLGYKKLLYFKQYYFQLGIDHYCEIDNCEYCINTRILPHFVLALYGWKDNTSNRLQPYEYVEIPEDNIMPEWDWNRK